MKLLIIGSRGFIGHHLFNYFSEKGNEVWGTDVVDDYINKERYFSCFPQCNTLEIILDNIV